MKIQVQLMVRDWIRGTLLCHNGFSLTSLINIKKFGLNSKLTSRNYLCGLNLFIADADRHLDSVIKSEEATEKLLIWLINCY